MLLYLKQAFCLIQSLLFIISSFSVYDSNFKFDVDRAALSLTSVKNFTFDPITAKELEITEKEKAECREWYNNNILSVENPAYDFKAGGKSFAKNTGDWSISVGEESAEGAVFRGGKTTYITLTHKKSGLEATVEATIYEQNAACEWTVFIKNNGNENSPVIKDFYAADCCLPVKSPTLYVSKGSEPAADDFELIKTLVTPTPMMFNANGGRSESFLPFFNISGSEGGIVAAVGWTGQWYSSVSRTSRGVSFKAKQEFLNGYLTPGEQIRSPLVSLCFYDGGNALKGFNSFRNWMSSCVYTESAYPVTCTVIAGEFDRRNADEYIAQINSYSEETCQRTDFLWRDAGWYKINTDWFDSVGNWAADPERFPNGLAPVADAAEARGMKLLLWFEPERCCKDTIVYNECIKHDGWLIINDDNINMVNLAFDGACDFLGNLVANALKENHVGLYRQDFNFTPLTMWQDADKKYFGGRKGFEENHYVTNLYRYLDTLLEVNPGLIIDNCASGGKRLDIEMSRRSIPLWRTDYNCTAADGINKSDSLESTQFATYGLSFWLPLHGTGLNIWGNEYADRTLIIPCAQRVGYEEIRKYTDKNYFPLTNGGLDRSSFHAMQFGDESEGAAVIYRREEVAENEYKLVLNGLNPESSYEISDYDSAFQPITLSGKELAENGITVSFAEAPKAAIILYKEVNR